MAARAQDIHDGREDLPRRHGLAPATRGTLIGSILRPPPRGNERLDLGPKLIGDFPKFDLWHPESATLPEPAPRLKKLFTDKRLILILILRSDRIQRE
jgi:hypothetical protein